MGKVKAGVNNGIWDGAAGVFFSFFSSVENLERVHFFREDTINLLPWDGDLFSVLPYSFPSSSGCRGLGR